MKKKPKISIENNIVYLTLDLKGLDLYERGKAIRRFVSSDTKIVEDYADTIIRAIMKKNGVFVPSNNKSSLEFAFDLLKRKGKTIQVVDFYKNSNFTDCEVLLVSNNKMTIILEESRYLQCAVEIREVDL